MSKNNSSKKILVIKQFKGHAIMHPNFGKFRSGKNNKKCIKKNVYTLRIIIHIKYLIKKQIIKRKHSLNLACT